MTDIWGFNRGENLDFVLWHTCFEENCLLHYIAFPEDEGRTFSKNFFYVLLTVHLSISLDNDQLDAFLLYFTIRPLQSSICFEHYMLIIRRLNCIVLMKHLVSSSQSVASSAQVGGALQPVLSQPVHRAATDWEGDTIQFNLLMMSM